MGNLNQIFSILIFLSFSSYAMNKAELIEAMASESGLSKADAKRALDSFIDTTSKALKKGNSISLVGFGSFSTSKSLNKNKKSRKISFDLDSSRLPQVQARYSSYFWLHALDHLGNDIEILNSDNLDYTGTHAQFISNFAPLVDQIIELGFKNNREILALLKKHGQRYFEINNLDKNTYTYIDSFFDITLRAWGNIGSSGEDGVSPAQISDQEIIDLIARHADLTIELTRAAVDSFFDITYRVMNRGESVKLGKFGTFALTRRPLRKGRNPQTGKEIKIAAKKVVKFKAGADLSKKVN